MANIFIHGNNDIFREWLFMLMFIFILIWGVNALAFRVLEPYIFFDSVRIQPLIFVAAGFIVMLIFLGIRRYEKTIGFYLIILGLILCSGIIIMSGFVPEEKDVAIYTNQEFQAGRTYDETYSKNGTNYIRHKVLYTAKLSDGYVASFERSFNQKGYDKEKTATVVSYNGWYTVMPLNLSKEYLSLIFHCGDIILFVIAGIEIVLGVCLSIRRKRK